MIRRGLSILCLVTAALPCLRAEDFVTKEEFNRFLQDYAKHEEENRRLKEQNEVLRRKVEDLQTVTAQEALDSKIDHFVGEAIKREETSGVRSGTTKFLLAGWADSGYEQRRGGNSTFTASFHPVFLWKIDDRLSFESDLTYSVIAYHIDDYATLEAGKFLTPFGAFIRRQHQTWSNKLPDDPLALDINFGLVPSYSVGAEVSGGFAACSTHFNYAAYVANGPRLNATNPESFGTVNFNNDIDNNRSKAVGGRVGVLPTADFEVGLSIQSSRIGDHHALNSNVDATLYGADATYTRDFDCLKGNVDLRAEWVWSRVDDSTYKFGADLFPFHDDRRNGGYVQFAYRPAKLKQKWARNLELVLRYDRLDNPDNGPRVAGFSAAQFMDHDRSTIGLDYWLAPRAVLKFAYEKDHGNDRAYLLQFALGF